MNFYEEWKREEEEIEFRLYPCSTNSIYITAEGNIYPCNLLVREAFCIGNLFKDSVAEILASGQAAIDGVAIQSELCLGCEYKYLCGGRCPAVRQYVVKEAELKQKNVFPPCSFYHDIENHLTFQSVNAARSRRDSTAATSPAMAACCCCSKRTAGSD